MNYKDYKIEDIIYYDILFKALYTSESPDTDRIIRSILLSNNILKKIATLHEKAISYYYALIQLNYIEYQIISDYFNVKKHSIIIKKYNISNYIFDKVRRKFFYTFNTYNYESPI